MLNDRFEPLDTCRVNRVVAAPFGVQDRLRLLSSMTLQL